MFIIVLVGFLLFCFCIVFTCDYGYLLLYGISLLWFMVISVYLLIVLLCSFIILCCLRIEFVVVLLCV